MRHSVAAAASAVAAGGLLIFAHAKHRRCCSVTKLRWNRSAEAIDALTTKIIAEHTAALDKIAAVSPAVLPLAQLFDATFGALSRADGIAAATSSQCTIPALVSTDPGVREVSAAAKRRLAAAFDMAYARADIYRVLAASWARGGSSRSDEQTRIASRQKLRFEKNGLALDASDQARVAELRAKLTDLQARFEQNINEDVSTVALASAELQGLPDAFVTGLPEEGGLRVLSLKAPTYVPVMQLATRPETRRKVHAAYGARCAESNGPILEAMSTTRHSIAIALGYPSHAHLVLSDKMASGPDAVHTFLDGIYSKLSPQAQSELQALQALKDADREATSPGKLEEWDSAYYSQRLKLQLGVDDETIRSYFPLPRVIRETLGIYQHLLGLQFTRMRAAHGAQLWHEDAELYECREAGGEAGGGALVGHFYLDLYSRDGKFGHQMVVPLRPGIELADGSSITPACAILGNLSKGSSTEPSLLRFREVETFFHEFGHVMHAICTKSKHSQLAWAWPIVPWPGGVEMDFLEVPSMCFQEWVYSSEALQRLSGHVDDASRKLPSETVQTLLRMKTLNVGLQNQKYHAMCKYDMAIHTHAPPYDMGDGCEAADIHELWHRLMEKYGSFTPIRAVRPAASWYHMAIGYDASYYGYLWAEVFARDLYEAFEKGGGVLDARLGRKFRKAILEPGASVDGARMLEAFLGRPPSDEPYLRAVLRSGSAK